MSDDQAEFRSAMDRLALVQRQVGEIGALVYADPQWLYPDYTEPQVLYALRDLIKPGQTVFDVGANFGHLSVAMSRRAGPRGAVCAFEANPEIVKRCQATLVRSGCGNVQVFSAAVYRASRQRLQLYLSDNMVADSVSRKVSDRSIEVRTVALDDFVADTGLVPDLVKMDIDGAEFDALCGFTRTIAKHAPMLILEQQPEDDRCFRLLREQGYAAFDLRSYEWIESFAEIPTGVGLLDLLYASGEQLVGTPYAGPIEKVIEADFSAKAFAWTGDRMYQTAEAIGLPVGRYIVDVDFSVETDAELKCGVAIGAVPIVQYHGRADWLTTLARTWVVAVEIEGPASLFFHFPHQADPALRVSRALIHRLPNFDGYAPLLT